MVHSPCLIGLCVATAASVGVQRKGSDEHKDHQRDAIHAGDGQQPSELLVLGPRIRDNRSIAARSSPPSRSISARALLHRRCFIHWKRLLIPAKTLCAPRQIACRT